MLTQVAIPIATVPCHYQGTIPDSEESGLGYIRIECVEHYLQETSVS